jgi:hypothetical protein
MKQSRTATTSTISWTAGCTTRMVIIAMIMDPCS